MRQEQLVPTGIQGLDTQLGGGVPPGSVILLLGESTNALYTFMDEFAAQGVAQGAQVRWVEMDRAASGVLRDVLRFVPEGANGDLQVIEAFEPAVKANPSNGEGQVRSIPPTEVRDAVLRLLHEEGGPGFRMVMTCLTTFLDHVSEAETMEFMRRLAYMNGETGGLVLVSLIPDAHHRSLVARLKHLATGVMEIGLERKGFGLYSTLKVEKLVGVPDATKLLLFSESAKGLRLESTRRVF